MQKEYPITEPERLDQAIARTHGCSRSQAVKLIQTGSVFLNNQKMTKPAKNVSIGDTMEIREGMEEKVPEKVSPDFKGINIPILYEDVDCLVVHKPAGFAVHPSETSQGKPTIIEILRAKYGANLDLVHRLDKETTGCLLIAKSAKAYAKLQKQFSDRSVQKTYLAIVAGIPKEKKARIEAEIGRSLVNRVKMSLFKTGYSRPAVTNYEVLAESTDAALLKCDIETGRTHQIRVHLSSIGHPILGDDKYNSADSRITTNAHGVTSLCLHARELRFTPPSKKKEVAVQAPVPEALKENAKRCEIDSILFN